MQKAYSKAIITIISFFWLFAAQAQTRLRLETPEGFVVRDVLVRAWTAFGLEIVISKDSVTGEYLADRNFNRLQVTGANYKKFDSIFKTEIAFDSRLTLVIEPVDVVLDQVIISTSKSEARLKESTVSISILKPYIVENKITTDISQALDQVPGVNVTDNQINIRNGNGWSYGAGSRVMVLVDDLPMLSGDAQTAQFSFMPVENLAGVEVVKSAGSVLYGSSALNGIVHIRSAEAREKPSARISAFTGFFDAPPRDSLRWNTKARLAHGTSGFFSQKFGNTGLTVTFNALNNQGYRMNEFDRRGRLSLRIKHDNKLHPGLAYGCNTSAQTGKSGSFLLWESFGYGYIPLDSGYNYSQSNKLAVDPFVYFNGKTYQQKLLGRALLLENHIDNGDTANDQSNGSSLYYGEYRISRNFLGKKLLATSGIVAMGAETHSPLFSGKQHSRNLAVYLQTELHLRRFTAQAGARLENYKLNSVEQTRPVFRVGANYVLQRFTFLRASWGQGFRFPSMAEAFISTSAGNVNIYPNPDLKPETGNNAEIGIKQGFRLGGFKGYTDLSAFRTTYSNLMEFTFAQWQDFSQPLFGIGFKSVNVGKVKIQGFEIETAGQGRIKQFDISILGGYTYTIPISVYPDSTFAKSYYGLNLNYANTRADTNNYLKYRSKHLLRVDVQAKYKNIAVGLSVRYNSQILNMDKAFVVFVDKSIGTAWKQLGGATVYDLRLGYYINPHWKLNFQILNLFNTLYMNRPADLRPPRSFQLQAVWVL